MVVKTVGQGFDKALLGGWGQWAVSDVGWLLPIRCAGGDGGCPIEGGRRQVTHPAVPTGCIRPSCHFTDWPWPGCF